MENQVKFCDQCGAKLEEGAKFCTSCGNRITAVDPVPEKAEVPRRKIVRPDFSDIEGAQTKSSTVQHRFSTAEYQKSEPQVSGDDFKTTEPEYAGPGWNEQVASPFKKRTVIQEPEEETVSESEGAPETDVVTEEGERESAPADDIEYIEPAPLDEDQKAENAAVEIAEPVDAAADVYDGEETVYLGTSAGPESIEQLFARTAQAAYLKKERSGEYVNIDKPEFIIGKNPNRTDYAIRDNKTISRVHASVKWTEDGYSIADLGSLNGTFVNGTQVGADGHMLYDGDVITLSDERFHFSLIEI